MKIHKGDNVIVIAGKDRGKSGSVLRAFPKENKVLVEGINIGTFHEKSRQRGQRGQIVERPVPVDVSNVAVKDKKSGKQARIGYTIGGKDDKVKRARVLRPSGEKF